MRTCTSLLLLLYFISLGIVTAAGGTVAREFLYRNFTASSLLFLTTGGVFLASPTGIFSAAVHNPGGQQLRFYLSVLHSPSNTVIWTANRGSPIPNTGTVHLTSAGLSVAQPDGTVAWSAGASPVSALRLLDSGNLLLLDAANATLWQSFDHPSDTLVSGQELKVGTLLSSAVNDSDPAIGDYSFTVTADDALMTWRDTGQIYWRLSMDLQSFQNSAAEVAYMAANSTGVYLRSAGGEVVFQIPLPTSDLKFIKLESTGQFGIYRYSAANATMGIEEFFVPANNCDLPLSCNALRLCSAGGNSSTCSCTAPFAVSVTGDCAPADGSILPPVNSTSCTTGKETSYISLGNGIIYFSIKFAQPTSTGQSFAACQSLCTSNCSCQGFFFRTSTKFCYLIDYRLGSLSTTPSNEVGSTTGYIKTLTAAPSPPPASSKAISRAHLIAIILPSIATLFLLILVSILAFVSHRRKKSRIASASRPNNGSITENIKLGRNSSRAGVASETEGGVDGDEEDDDSIGDLIPSLPSRFTYAELSAATKNFSVKIGSGGFGSVYKGELPDKTLVAVKRIEKIGVQGKREFCTEIAVISNIHHVNLVRLRGFSAEGRKRLLVYEYMNRSSLDHSLFGVGPPLEWQERVEIAIGAARGLAYLHSGCSHKIIHCDVKPENILLHDGVQVKIADFGLAKLLSPEQSGLFTTMRGTRGYLAPEWLTNSAISDWTDVYSFGMVLLELVSGRKNRSVTNQETSSSSSAAASGSGGTGEYFPLVALERHEEGKYRELADGRLEGRVREEEVRRVVKVALCCLHEEPPLRPSMAAVAAMLEGQAEAWEPRLESLRFLRLYGRGFADPAGGGRGQGLAFDFGSHDTVSLYPLASMIGSDSTSPFYMSSQQISGPR